ncbi:lysine 2,3-aminomutase [bacterium SCSIO 12741]|nr:lysine 2,3-aminomutase [bacterium SCSIO 12741]
MIQNKKYQAYSLHNFRQIPQMKMLSEEQLFTIEVVGHVLPFKVNNYILDELIDWNNFETDPMFLLTFPQRGMLSDKHFNTVAEWVRAGRTKKEMKKDIDQIRLELNPHPAGQKTQNVPSIHGIELSGVQHKYKETVLFFPRRGQTCHAYCTFCFRWPQFVGIDDLKFAMNETHLVVEYLKAHPEVTDLIFTGGDPMVMATKVFKPYLEALIEADIPHLQNIRIGTKSLTFWPYKYVNDPETDELLDLFRKVKAKGKHLTIMAHFNNPVELSTPVVQKAIENILETGVQIRTQAPIMKGINDNADWWAAMWRHQVKLGCIPYYMFIARDTGARDFFAVPLEKCYQIFRDAYSQVSGICRTVRGPSMSAAPGKVQVLGIEEINGEKVMALSFLQGRNPDWVGRPFFAKYDPEALWLTDLKPAFGQTHFLYEDGPQMEDSVEETESAYEVNYEEYTPA